MRPMPLNQAWAVPVGVFAAALIGVVVLFWPTLAAMEQTWRVSDSYQHTYVVPFVIAYLVWENRDRLAALTPQVAPSGFVFLFLAGLGWLLGDAANVQVVQQLAVVGILQSLVLIIFGWRVALTLWFPLAFLIFLVPLGEALIPTLQQWTAGFLVLSGEFIGLPVATDGYIIQVADGSQPYHFFHVAKECSGIRYLTVMFQIGLLASYLLFQSWPRRVGAVAFALLVPIVANWLRALGIVLIVYHTEGRHGQDVDHIIYGFWFFLFVLLIYVGICWRMADSLPAARQITSVSQEPAKKGRTLMAGMLAVILAALAPAYAAYTEVSPGKAAELKAPPAAAGWRQMAYRGLDWHPVFRGTDSEVIARYTKGADKLDLYVAYYDYQRQGAELINSENDLAGDRWQHTGIEGTVNLDIAGQDRTFAYIRIVGRGRARIVFYAYWIDDQLAIGSLNAKLMAAKARLLGGDQASAVFAISTDYDGDVDAARQAAQLFLDDLSPMDMLK